MTLKLLAPISSLNEMETLLPLGADEFYLGYLSDECKEEFSNVFSFNLRQFSRGNFTSQEELGDAVKLAHAHGKKVGGTFNNTFFEAQYPPLLREIERMMSFGVDSILVGDLGLLLKIRRLFPDLTIHISTKGATFNSYSAEFYKSFDVSRIILPRHLKVDEVKLITSLVPDIHFEVFIISERCVFTNSLCFFEHGLFEARGSWAYRLMMALKRLKGGKDTLMEKDSAHPLLIKMRRNFVKKRGPVCLRNFTAVERKPGNHESSELGVGSWELGESEIVKDMRMIEERNIKTGAKTNKFKFNFYKSFSHYRNSCGACALFVLKDIENLCTVKVVGRDHPTEKKVMDVKFIRFCLDLLNSTSDQEEYRHKVKERFEQIFSFPCDRSYCYWPELYS